MKNLVSGYISDKGYIRVIRNLTFEVKEGEILGISGESGSGKTTLLYSLFNALSMPGYIKSGSVEIDGKNIFEMKDEELRKIRGEIISFVPQGSQNSLNPVKKIIGQFKDIIESHERSMGMEDIKRVLNIVHLDEEILNRYPHEISGGMKQRVIIAMALLYSPKLIIMDEPTTGLDVLVQYEILKTIKEIQKNLSLSIIFVTHDIALLFQIADRIMVLYGGDVMEIGPYNELLNNVKHPYTKLLLNSIPTMSKHLEKLDSLPGEPISFANKPPGCIFSTRCPFVKEVCKVKYPEERIVGNSTFRCERYPEWKKEYAYLETKKAEVKMQNVSTIATGDEKLTHILEVENLVKRFYVHDRKSKQKYVEVIHGVNMYLNEGEIVALVGASGSGKSTIANLLLRELNSTSGKILFKGEDITHIKGRKLKEYWRNVQMVYQDPYSSLDPTHDIEWHIKRPLVIRHEKNVDQTIDQILTELSLVPTADFRKKMPHELSGGLKQRVYIARALATSPSVLIADEPVSMLDASTKASILELFKFLMKSRNISILYITHDLSTVSYVADRIYIIKDGNIVESGRTSDVLHSPKDPYTLKLIEAAPDPYRRIKM